MINKFLDKKVLIFGLGLNRGGLGSAKFFANNAKEVRVTDLKTERSLKPTLDELIPYKNISYSLGGHKNEDIDWADIIIRNPAVKSTNEYIAYAKKQNKKVTTDIGVFLNLVDRSKIIGITGSKGKSTTASLVYYALRQKNQNCILAGNIGTSVLESLEYIDSETLIVLELSSFQLESFDELSISPHISVLLNLLPDHLNYYKDFEEYTEAKQVIAKYQTESDFLFINKDDLAINNGRFLAGFKSHIYKFSKNDLPQDFKPKLLGLHNLANYSAALAVSKQMGIDEEEALENMNQFSGAEFRLQLIKNSNGIKIYNDSASTMPDSTIGALKSLNNSILICGGMDKGLDYENLARQIDLSAKAVFFIEGTATDKLLKLIKHRNIHRSIYSSLENLLKDVRIEAKKGDIILFSPGATSFNLFQNEFDRGRKFNIEVKKQFGN